MKKEKVLFELSLLFPLSVPQLLRRVPSVTSQDGHALTRTYASQRSGIRYEAWEEGEANSTFNIRKGHLQYMTNLLVRHLCVVVTLQSDQFIKCSTSYSNIV